MNVMPLPFPASWFLRYFAAFALGLVLFWSSPFIDACRLSYCIGVAGALLIVVMTVVLWGASGLHALKEIKGTGDQQKKGIESMLILLMTGISCVLLTTAYSIAFPPHLSYLEYVHIFVWETASPSSLFNSSLLLSFLFVFGCVLSLLSLSFIAASGKSIRSQDHFTARVIRDFGWALAAVAACLVVSTAVFHMFIFFMAQNSPYSIGGWEYPNLYHGFALFFVSIFLLATSAILKGRAFVFRNTKRFWRFVSAGILLVSWLVLSGLSCLNTFSYLQFVSYLLAFSTIFLATDIVRGFVFQTRVP